LGQFFTTSSGHPGLKCKKGDSSLKMDFFNLLKILIKMDLFVKNSRSIKKDLSLFPWN
jgi:hypothetical protein